MKTLTRRVGPAPSVDPKRYLNDRWIGVVMKRSSPILHLAIKKELNVTLCGSVPVPGIVYPDPASVEQGRPCCAVCAREADRVLSKEHDLRTKRYSYTDPTTSVPYEIREGRKGPTMGWRVVNCSFKPPKLVRWFPTEDEARNWCERIEGGA